MLRSIKLGILVLAGALLVAGASFAESTAYYPIHLKLHSSYPKTVEDGKFSKWVIRATNDGNTDWLNTKAEYLLPEGSKLGKRTKRPYKLYRAEPNGHTVVWALGRLRAGRTITVPVWATPPSRVDYPFAVYCPQIIFGGKPKSPGLIWNPHEEHHFPCKTKYITGQR